MASKLDHNVVAAGYYHTEDINDVILYVVKFLKKFGTCRVDLHPYALVQWEDHMERQHCKAKGMFFDELTPDIGDKIGENLINFFSDEHAAYFQGSGGRILELDSWFFSIWKATRAGDFIEANRLNPERPNSVENKVYLGVNWKIEGDVGNDYAPKRSGSFWGALGGALTLTTRINKQSHQLSVGKFLTDTFLEEYLKKVITIGSVARIIPYIKEQIDVDINVYSTRGMLLYGTGITNEQSINLIYRNDGKWCWVGNKFNWGVGTSNTYGRIPPCFNCNRQHQDDEECSIFKGSKSDRVAKPDLIKDACKLVIYCDFEALTGEDKYHRAIGARALVIYNNSEIYGEYEYWGLDCPDNLLTYIENVITRYHGYDNDEDLLSCPCGKKYTETNWLIARSFINAKLYKYHKFCFATDHKNKPIVYFHNFTGYDSHLIIRDLIRRYGEFAVIAKTFEKINNVSINNGLKAFIIRDSIAHFGPGASIAKLAKTIVEYNYTPIEYQGGKDYFPYKWFDHEDKLAEPIPLNIEDWHTGGFVPNTTDMEYITNLIAEKGWTSFRQWASYYIKKDVYILCEVFEAYRKATLEAFETDPCYYLGAPALTWNLACSTAYEDMGIITDVNIQRDIQANIRGGVSQCCHRYAKVEKPDQSILYLDINSLYSFCMMQPLPAVFVAKCPSENFPDDWRRKYGDWNGDFIAFVKCDLDHAFVMDSALAPAPHRFNNRLCTTYLPKDNYLVHSVLLAYWLSCGMRLKKVHYYYVFENIPIFENYVSNNIVKRREELNNPIKKDLYKLLNNSLYGKTCENKAKYRNFAVNKLENDEAPMYRRNNGPLMNSLVVDEYLFTEYAKKEIILDKPVQIGFGVLERAKFEIFKFYYELKSLFGDYCNLLYTDTDSLILFFDKVDPIAILRDSDLWQYMDWVELDGTRPREKEAGLWSDDVDGKRITEFVGLRSKTYAIKFADDKTKLKNKGIVLSNHIVKSVIQDKRSLNFDDYKNVLFNDKVEYVDQFIFKSKKHNIKTGTQVKKALDTSDFKRKVLEDGISTECWQ